MKALTKVLALGGAATLVAGAIATIVARRRKARAGAHENAAGSMTIGPLDEVELAAGLARPMRPDANPESFDPEEVPSEYAEINELRTKMPFG